MVRGALVYEHGGGSLRRRYGVGRRKASGPGVDIYRDQDQANPPEAFLSGVWPKLGGVHRRLEVFF